MEFMLMKEEKIKELIENLKALLYKRDGVNYSDDTLILSALEKELERIKVDYG